ncbi:MAG TPA: hypothetical protein VK074_05010, partial [Fodinibius sp.]|nr:hypothetical protein [Fodinibius sp.]
KHYIDLGNLRELAEIRLNGEELGIIWSPPFRVEITEALLSKKNELEIDVVNFWPNRIVGDHSLPEQERYTRTNIEEITGETPLSVSGLLGPVRILESG